MYLHPSPRAHVPFEIEHLFSDLMHGNARLDARETQNPTQKQMKLNYSLIVILQGHKKTPSFGPTLSPRLSRSLSTDTSGIDSN